MINQTESIRAEGTAGRRYKVAIIAPTCFYYQVELFRQLSADPRLDLVVYFCSDEALNSKDAEIMYNTDREWGIAANLLDGFKSKFIKNYSPTPSYLKWPFGLINFGVWSEIRKLKPDAVVIMSWMNPTWWLAVLASSIYKIPLFYMTDANFYTEGRHSSWKNLAKKLLLGRVLFPLTTGFLCAGGANMNLYRYYDVPEDKLIPFAYSWGYQNLLDISPGFTERKDELRKTHGFRSDSFVLLFCGRLSKEKGIELLLEAYRRVSTTGSTLVLVGDGELKSSLLEYIERHGLDSVRFAGFKNRTEIAEWYALADAVVLPSFRETWGIVVNEAMCFGLPVIVSDAVGAGDDLVIDGFNGYKFSNGNVNELADKLSAIMNLTVEEMGIMGERSRKLLEDWSQRDLAAAMLDNLDSVYSPAP